MSNDSANARINNLAERCAIGLLSLVIGFMFTTYQDQRQDYKALEEKVLVMQMNKVNKEDLKDAVNGLNLKMDAMASSLIQRSAADKQDILQRLDLYFGKLKK